MSFPKKMADYQVYSWWEIVEFALKSVKKKILILTDIDDTLISLPLGQYDGSLRWWKDMEKTGEDIGSYSSIFAQYHEKSPHRLTDCSFLQAYEKLKNSKEVSLVGVTIRNTQNVTLPEQCQRVGITFSQFSLPTFSYNYSQGIIFCNTPNRPPMKDLAIHEFLTLLNLPDDYLIIMVDDRLGFLESFREYNPYKIITFHLVPLMEHLPLTFSRESNPSILLLLTGEMGSGKDSLAASLGEINKTYQQFEVGQFSLARPIKRMARRLCEVFYSTTFNENLFWDNELKGRPIPQFIFNHHTFTPREVLQVIGTDIMRNEISPEIWIDLVEKEIRSKEKYKKKRLIVSVTDVRFPNEVVELKQRFSDWIVLTIRLERFHRTQSQLCHLASHSSEKEMTAIVPDVSIGNNGSLKDLEFKALRIYSALIL